MVEFLRERATIASAKACLERFHRTSNLLHRTSLPAGQEPEQINVRIFLAAYMIVLYPNKAFSTIGDLETRVMRSAQALLQIFGGILPSTVPLYKLPLDLTKSLPNAIFNYLRDFKAWKVPDQAKLASRIKHALVALYDARRMLPADEPENSQLNTEFRTQICRLRHKLGQIAGVEVLARFDEEHPEGVSSASVDSALELRNRLQSLRAQGAVVVALPEHTFAAFWYTSDFFWFFRPRDLL